MSKETLLAILQRAHDDLLFRAMYENAPEGLLSQHYDLTLEERELLAQYPSTWLDEHSVTACPGCGGPATVSRRGAIIVCDICGLDARADEPSEYGHR